MAATWLQQMKVMMWKAFLIKRRHPGSLYWVSVQPVCSLLSFLLKMTLVAKNIALLVEGYYQSIACGSEPWLEVTLFAGEKAFHVCVKWKGGQLIAKNGIT